MLSALGCFFAYSLLYLLDLAIGACILSSISINEKKICAVRSALLLLFSSLVVPLLIICFPLLMLRNIVAPKGNSKRRTLISFIDW